MPMMVTTMMTPAASQAMAIQRPPNSTQSMLRKSGSGAMASACEIAEFAAQIGLARGDLAFRQPQSRLEIAEAAPERGERILRCSGDAAPEGGLLGARI